MDFYTVVGSLALVLLIISLTLYGVYYNKLIIAAFPETQDPCPKMWRVDICGNCYKPTGTLNNLDITTGNTPSSSIITMNDVNTGFKPADSGWNSWNGAKSSICGKKKWCDSNKIEWNGISNYNSC